MYDSALEFLYRVQEACTIGEKALGTPGEINAATRLELRKWFVRIHNEAFEWYDMLEDQQNAKNT